MKFTPKFFDLPRSGLRKRAATTKRTPFRYEHGDDSQVYVFSPEIVLAVNVAFATRRPLLVSGDPGSGKTTLARAIAAVKRWWYYEEVVTSRTQASDLEASFDTLQRLNDANERDKPLGPRSLYLDPGVLWWAFDPADARRRGDPQLLGDQHARDPGVQGESEHAVLLLDEIDKADPDVPNDLLEAFDTNTFTVRETRHPVIRHRDVFLMLTTNGERELPPAFMRRCVHLSLPAPTEQELVEIANQQFGEKRAPLHHDIAREIVRLRREAKSRNHREPSTAEFLDAIQACDELGVSVVHGDEWRSIAKATLWKQDTSEWPAMEDEGA